MSVILQKLLGKHFDEVTSDEFISKLGVRPKLKKIDDRYYLMFKKAGIAFGAALDRKVMSIFLYSKGHERSPGFAGELPRGISFSDSREEIRKKLGDPTASGGGGGDPILGRCPTWDRYDLKAFTMDIQYAENEESVIMVFLMRPDSVPK